MGQEQNLPDKSAESSEEQMTKMVFVEFPVALDVESEIEKGDDGACCAS